MIPKQIVIHHTVSSRDNTTLLDIDNWHKSRWPDFCGSLGYYVGYHWVIGKDWIVQTRRENELGAHSIPNDGKIGICLVGNFETEQPTEYQLDEVKKLVILLKIKYNLSDKDVYFHRDLSRTLCPGNNITRSVISVGSQGLRRLLLEILRKLLNK